MPLQQRFLRSNLSCSDGVAMLEKKDDELRAEKALTELNQGADEEEEDEVTKLPCRDPWIQGVQATASQTLGIYCTLVTEPDTEGQLTKLI